MANIYSIDGVIPVVHHEAFVHPTAVLIGDVIIGPGCYVGPCASLRGDFGRLILKRGANLQDSCVMHGFPHTDTVIEEDGHIGHGAILHGCTIKRDALVGMNAVVMDGAVIGEESRLHASVTIYPRCVIGRRAVIHSGAVIGADGFGMAPDGDRWIKIPQTGRVIIGDDS